MRAEEKVKKLLEFAARAVLIDPDDLRAAIEEAEHNLPREDGFDRAIAAADIEMARRVLTYTVAYAELMKAVTRDYRGRIVRADAAADSAKRSG